MVMVLFTSAAPAQAHPVNVGADPTNWHSTITAVPPGGAISATLGDNALRITLVAHTTAPVVVVGYDGEPFLRMTASGVWANDRSSTTWATAPTRRVPPPSLVNDRAPAQWRQVAPTGSWTWHDVRTHWAGYAPPEPVSRHPDRAQYVSTWSIPVLVDGQRALLSGRIDWVPGPHPARGLTITIVAFVAIVAIAAARRWRLPTAAAAVTVSALDAAQAWALVTGRVGGTWTKLSALPLHGLLTLWMWLVLLTCAVALVRRRHLTAATYAVAMISAVIFLGDAVPSVSLVWRSQAISGMPIGLDRVLVAALTGASAGLLVCVCLLIRRHDRPRVAAPAGLRLTPNPAA
jgi:hypothetical protein